MVCSEVEQLMSPISLLAAEGVVDDMVSTNTGGTSGTNYAH